MRIDYSCHEDFYQRYAQAGRPGWETVEQFNRTLVTIERFLQSPYVPRRGRLLELGCGNGSVTLWLAARGYEAYGIDISPTAVQWAREAADRRRVAVDFRVGNVTDALDFPDNFFDVILDGNVLHCIVGEHRRDVMLNIRQVLKPGGCIHIGSMCGEVKGRYFREWYDPRTRCVLSPTGDIMRYVGCAEEILNEVKKAGLFILNWQIHPITNQGDDNEYLEVDAIKP